MLNNLYESICITSGLAIKEELFFCSPPYIYYNEIKHNLNAKMIFPFNNHIAILTLDNHLQIVDNKLLKLSNHILSTQPQVIHSYGDFLLIDYELEYQICNFTQLQDLKKKNKIVSFAPNPYQKITYVIKNKKLENNIAQYDKPMDIEMGVEQIYLISSQKPLYLYQSVVLPQLTIIDLELCEEIYHIEFDTLIDRIILFEEDQPIIVCGNKLSQLKNNKIVSFNRCDQIQLSCIVEFTQNQEHYILFGSSNENSLVFQNQRIIKSYYNLGQIIDIHPQNQICYIASLDKKYPISLFRKGINEQILEKYKFDTEVKPRKVFFINQRTLVISFSQSTEVYSLPNFSLNNTNILKNQRTLFCTQVNQDQILQITSNKCRLIDQQNNTFQESHFEEKVIECCYEKESQLLYIYMNENKIVEFQIYNTGQIEMKQKYELNQISAFQIISNQLYYSKWFCNELHNLQTKKVFHIKNNNESTIVSIESTKNYILLGLNNGNLIAVDLDNYENQKIFQISTSHPIKLMKYNFKVLIFSHHIYMIDNQLQQINVNWDHLYEVSQHQDKLAGIVGQEVQIVTLSQGSNIQCRELKFIKDISIKFVRFFKDHLILINTTDTVLSYFDDQIKSQIDLKFKSQKMECYDNIYIAGYNESEQGNIIILNEMLQMIRIFTFNDPIYDFKLYHDQIYFSSNTIIQNTENTFSYNFQIPILGFDIKDKYFLIYEQFKGVHLFYYDEKMVALGSLCFPCQYAQFYYEDIIGFSETEVKIAKQNLLTFMISERLEVLLSIPIQVTCVKDKHFGTMFGVLGYYE